MIQPGVPKSLADQRAELISEIHYDLDFDIPASVDDSIPGRLILRFALNDTKQDLLLDFKEEADHLLGITDQDGNAIKYTFEQEHIIIPSRYLQSEDNYLDIRFIAGDLSLNRNLEYVYTLLVPDRARTVFPCFDQPNLKAAFQLQLDIPDHWTALSNGSLKSDSSSSGRRTMTFNPSAPISTYLFSFVAGAFEQKQSQINGQNMTMLYRDQDSSTVARNADAIFELHEQALTWLEDYTAIPYPFEKFDFALIPSFQYGGMEHVGNIFYKEESLMLDESPTQEQLLGRASLIAHETAHMWFGDLVTMEWFNDVWLKEVFANFMAAKIINPSFPDIDHELRFMLDHQPSAYSEDRSQGTHPIQQELNNLDEAGTLYGRIIYEKSPVVMRQLEALLGERALQEGLRQYLKDNAYGNAGWDDLIDLLSTKSEENLKVWSEVWVKEAGMPHYVTELQAESQQIRTLQLRQDRSSAEGNYWTQQTVLALMYPDGVYRLPVIPKGMTPSIPEVAGRDVPEAVLPNASPIHYGYFELDERSQNYLMLNADQLEEPLLRGAAWLALYEEFLRGDADLRDNYLRALTEAIEEEEVSLIRDELLGQLRTVFWRFTSPERRQEIAPLIESLLWYRMQAAAAAGDKRSYFQTYQSIALSAEAVNNLLNLYQDVLQIPGLKLSETDRIDLAAELALRLPDRADQLLQAAMDSTQNQEKRARLDFIRPALAADVAQRQSFFDRILHAEHRTKEPWVAAGLAYLNHPLRAKEAVPYIRPGLERLPEIQETGDIFFPRRWAGALLSGHRSPEAAKAVRDFLADNPAFPKRLRNKVLMAADLLFRATPLQAGDAPNQ